MSDLQKQRQREAWAGENNPAWKGGVTYFKKRGNYVGARYVRCPEAYLPMARKSGYVLEHRLMVALAIGRCLTKSEVVHHDNHDPIDNRLENIMLFKNNRDHKLYENGHPIKPLWQGSNE
jgi:hypothetical protein